MVRNDARGRIAAMMIAGCLTLSACGGGMGGYSASAGASASGSSTSSSPATGQAMVALSDAPGDLLSYIVTLDSLELLTADGTAVETIPAKTQVDFAQLVNLSEILTARQIPAASYVAARLTIDYANAQITADDGTGNPVLLTPVDGSGNPITGTLTVTVQLDSEHHLEVQPQHAGQLALDFNLAVSNAVHLTNDTVTVAPTLVASVTPSETRSIRVRGGFDSADTAHDDLLLDVQPFHDGKVSAGTVTVQVNSGTSYLINGTALTGDAGLAALAALPAGTPVSASGTVDATAGAQATLVASMILAGSSLESPNEDRLSGTVIARDQTTLTLRSGRWLHESDDDMRFQRQDSTILIGDGTTVTEEGRTGGFTVQSISVGQHVEAAGSATQASDGSVTLDATGGQVRLVPTSAWGTVGGQSGSSLTLNLQSIDGLPASVFNFGGTGASASDDATPGAYIVDTGSLTQNGVVVGGAIGVVGFAAPFNLAPPDFLAETLVTATATNVDLQVQFRHGGSLSAFVGLTATSTSLVLQLPTSGNGGKGNNSGSDNVTGDNGARDGSASVDGEDGDSKMRMGWMSQGLNTVASPLTIVPDPHPTDPVFTISHQGSMRNETFSTFQAFVVALAAEIDVATRVQAVSASGQYDASSNTFTAQEIAVVLND